jgi:HSP20 family molecular chaperone IbpA
MAGLSLIDMNTKLFFVVPLSIALGASAWAESSPSPSPMASPNASNSSAATPAPGTWDPFADMQRMQNDMDQFFSKAMNQFGMNQDFLTMRNEPGFASSLNVRDKGDHYEVDAFLPGAEMNDVKVTTEPNNSLRIAASQAKDEKNKSKTGETEVAQFGEYQQLVRLPGDARTKDFKLDRKQNEVVISVPKNKTK